MVEGVVVAAEADEDLTLADPGIRDLLLPVDVPLTEGPHRVVRRIPMYRVIVREDEATPGGAGP